MDSFLEESQRHNPFALSEIHPNSTSASPNKNPFPYPPIDVVGVWQKVVQPVSLPDGTPLPVGTIFSLPDSVLDREEGMWSHPDEFDGLRYYNLHRSSAEESKRHQLSDCSADSMSFGYGAHTCSGRFFASDTLKLIVGHLIKSFDLESKVEKNGRPENMEINFNVLPDPTVEIMFESIA